MLYLQFVNLWAEAQRRSGRRALGAARGWQRGVPGWPRSCSVLCQGGATRSASWGWNGTLSAGDGVGEASTTQLHAAISALKCIFKCALSCLLNFTFFYSQFISDGEQSSARAVLCWCWVRAVLATVCNYQCQRNPQFYWVPFHEDLASCATGLGTAQTYPRWVSSCVRITNDSVLHFGQALCLAWTWGSLRVFLGWCRGGVAQRAFLVYVWQGHITHMQECMVCKCT